MSGHINCWFLSVHGILWQENIHISQPISLYIHGLHSRVEMQIIAPNNNIWVGLLADTKYRYCIYIYVCTHTHTH